MKQERFAVSTCAFRKRNVAEIDKIGLENGFTMEFSSGFPYEPGLADKFLAAKCSRLIHNYFPPPETPFVLNLASTNPDIWNKSVAHGKQALNMVKAAGGGFYSIHAGFCVDPDTRELGKKFVESKQPIDREAHWQAFLRALRALLEEANRLGVDLLVENNVTIRDNVASDGSVPLLCTAPEDIARLFRELTDSRLALLLDTAHLKVSAQSLGFDTKTFMAAAGNHIRGVHHSDNDGTIDNNRPLTPEYWFLPHMPALSNAWHVLEVLDLTPDQVREHMALLRSAMKS